MRQLIAGFITGLVIAAIVATIIHLLPDAIQAIGDCL